MDIAKYILTTPTRTRLKLGAAGVSLALLATACGPAAETAAPVGTETVEAGTADAASAEEAAAGLPLDFGNPLSICMRSAKVLVKSFTSLSGGASTMARDRRPEENEVRTWAWLQDELRAKAEAIAVSLRSGVLASDPVPGLDWNVGRLGAHMVAIPQFHLRAQDVFVGLPDVSNPAAVNQFSEQTAADVGTSDPDELASILPTAIEQLIARLGDDGSTTAKWYEHDMTVLELGGVVLSELLLHHHDLARATAQERGVAKITNEQAQAAFRGLFAASPHVVNPHVARECQGVIHIFLTGSGGGEHWTTTISGETAITTPGNPPVADFHTMANPVELLLVTQGRGHEVKALLTGQIVGIGRKPKLGLKSRNLYYSL